MASLPQAHTTPACLLLALPLTHNPSPFQQGKQSQVGCGQHARFFQAVRPCGQLLHVSTSLQHLFCFVLLLLQENYFFDGPNKELNSRLVVLRLRFYDTDKKAVLTLKVCWLCAVVCGVQHTAAALLSQRAVRRLAVSFDSHTRPQGSCTHCCKGLKQGRACVC